jgi:nitrogen fixation NifU-like protein
MSDDRISRPSSIWPDPPTAPAGWRRPTARRSGDSPLCGDRVRMEVTLEGGRIDALAHEVKGCLLCRAAAAAIGSRAAGLDAAQLAALRGEVAALLAGQVPTAPSWPELKCFEPVRPHRNRHGCVLLPFDTLAAALDSAQGA